VNSTKETHCCIRIGSTIFRIIISKNGKLLIKKKEWLNDKIKQIEEANRRNETQKFYQDSAFINKQSHIIPLCKENKGEILPEKTSVLENCSYLQPLP
jgi:ABC-type oligopeptide transport system ATPase subunit